MRRRKVGIWRRLRRRFATSQVTGRTSDGLWLYPCRVAGHDDSVSRAGLLDRPGAGVHPFSPRLCSCALWRLPHPCSRDASPAPYFRKSAPNPKTRRPPPKRHFGGSDKSSLLQETQHPDIDSDEAIERLGADILEHGEGRSSALRQVVDGHRLMLMPMPMMPPPRAPIQAVLPRVHPLGSPPWIKFLVLFLLAAWLPLGLTLFDCHRWSGHGRV